MSLESVNVRQFLFCLKCYNRSIIYFCLTWWPLFLKDWAFCFSPCIRMIKIGRSLCCFWWFVYAAVLVDLKTFSKKFRLVRSNFTPDHKSLKKIVGVNSLLHLSLRSNTGVFIGLFSICPDPLTDCLAILYISSSPPKTLENHNAAV